MGYSNNKHCFIDHHFYRHHHSIIQIQKWWKQEILLYLHHHDDFGYFDFHIEGKKKYRKKKNFLKKNYKKKKKKHKKKKKKKNQLFSFWLIIADLFFKTFSIFNFHSFSQKIKNIFFFFLFLSGDLYCLAFTFEIPCGKRKRLLCRKFFSFCFRKSFLVHWDMYSLFYVHERGRKLRKESLYLFCVDGCSSLYNVKKK